MRPRQLWSNLPVPATVARARPHAALAAVLTLATAAAALIWLRLSRYVVRGPSMEPALRDGDRLLVLRGAQRLRAPRPGEIVLARPRALDGREIVKRVAAVERANGGLRLTLLGDNPAASTDSRTFGLVSRAEITGRVLLRYWPDERRGRIANAAGVTPPAASRGRRPR
jgi:nickel-type superoxide dismutase maturation protease